MNFTTYRTSSKRTVTFPQLGILHYIWGAHWRHLANTIEPSICGGDAVLCQFTLTTCFHIITFTQADAPYQAAAQIEPRTNGTLRVSRSTARRPSGLATGLHGQGFKCIILIAVFRHFSNMSQYLNVYFLLSKLLYPICTAS